jgi:pimeloyl-ACP methyl ester carboxylesterase
VSTVRLGLLSAALGLTLLVTGPAARAQPDVRSATGAVLEYAHIGKRRLAFYVVPGRAPAVLFEAGGGLDSSSWSTVVGPIHRATGAQLILYDRAGEGASDEDPRPYSLKNSVDDLKAGLDQIGAPKRFVFVGHSFAGEIGTAFITQNPGRFAGAVLVDANIPSFFTSDVIGEMAATFPRAPDRRTKSARTVAAMMQVFPQMQAAFHAMAWPKDTPVIVILSDHAPLASARQTRRWIDANTAFVAEAPNRRLVHARGSSHSVMLDRPDVVVQAVADAVRIARGGQP